MRNASMSFWANISGLNVEAYSLEPAALEMTQRLGFASLRNSGEWNSVTVGFCWMLGLAFAPWAARDHGYKASDHRKNLKRRQSIDQSSKCQFPIAYYRKTFYCFAIAVVWDAMSCQRPLSFE